MFCIVDIFIFLFLFYHVHTLLLPFFLFLLFSGRVLEFFFNERESVSSRALFRMNRVSDSKVGEKKNPVNELVPREKEDFQLGFSSMKMNNGWTKDRPPTQVFEQFLLLHIKTLMYLENFWPLYAPIIFPWKKIPFVSLQDTLFFFFLRVSLCVFGGKKKGSVKKKTVWASKYKDVKERNHFSDRLIKTFRDKHKEFW